MKLHALCIALLFLGGAASAQQKLSSVDTKDLTDEQLEHLQAYQHLDDVFTTDGWVHLRHEGQNIVYNFSNPEYIFRVTLNCINKQPPGFLIEFSDKYRDGDYGGIDYLSVSDAKKVHFIIDDKNFDNPFIGTDDAGFKTFVEALKKGTTLTVDVVDERKIDFKLANGAFLDLPVECYERRESDTLPYEKKKEEEPVEVQIRE